MHQSWRISCATGGHTRQRTCWHAQAVHAILTKSAFMLHSAEPSRLSCNAFRLAASMCRTSHTLCVALRGPRPADPSALLAVVDRFTAQPGALSWQGGARA